MTIFSKFENLNFLANFEKNTPSEWIIWERSEADAKHWLDHEVNLYDEILRIQSEMKSKKNGAKKTSRRRVS